MWRRDRDEGGVFHLRAQIVQHGKTVALEGVELIFELLAFFGGVAGRGR